MVEYLHKNGRQYRITLGKKGEGLSAGAKIAKGLTLSDVYGRYSSAKASAYEDCKARCDEMQGENFRIISANVYIFGIAFEVTDDETGVIVTCIDTGRTRYYVYY